MFHIRRDFRSLMPRLPKVVNLHYLYSFTHTRADRDSGKNPLTTDARSKMLIEKTSSREAKILAHTTGYVHGVNVLRIRCFANDRFINSFALFSCMKINCFCLFCTERSAVRREKIPFFVVVASE